jgi:hypothetical protein
MIKVLANCKSYNGHKNVLFMMDADDFRILDSEKWGYEVLDAKAEYNRKERTLTSGKDKYHVFSDRSLKKL